MRARAQTGEGKREGGGERAKGGKSKRVHGRESERTQRTIEEDRERE